MQDVLVYYQNVEEKCNKLKEIMWFEVNKPRTLVEMNLATACKLSRLFMFPCVSFLFFTLQNTYSFIGPAILFFQNGDTFHKKDI